MGCGHDFALAIEICICMDLDGFVRVDVLEEPFELNGCRQVIILLGDAADEEGSSDFSFDWSSGELFGQQLGS